MKTIPLTKGKFAIVDDENFEWLSQWKWHYRSNKYGGYAARLTSRNNKPRHVVWMHREIAGIPPGLDTDHIDGDRLNNQKSNLRKATRSQNKCNIKERIDNACGYKGVCFNKARRKFVAQITLNGKYVYLGLFTSALAAANAYDAKAVELHKEFAYLNQRNMP